MDEMDEGKRLKPRLCSHHMRVKYSVSTQSKILPLPGLEQGQPFVMSSLQAGVQQDTLGSPGTSHPVQMAGSGSWVAAAPCPSSEASSPRMSTRTWLDGRNACPEHPAILGCVLPASNSAVSTGSSCRASSWVRSILPLSFD